MGEFIDRAKGRANEAGGKARVAIGRKADKPGLAIKGAAQQGKGKAQKLIGKVKGVLGDKF